MDLISRKALLDDLCQDREEGTFEFNEKQAEAADKIVRYVNSRIEAQSSVPAVPLEMISKKLGSLCKPCIFQTIGCPYKSFDCDSCNTSDAWEKAIRKWMEEEDADRP